MNPELRKSLFFPRTIASTVAYSITVSGVSFASPQLAYEMARSYSRKVLDYANARVNIEGEEHLPPGPVVLVANHQSLLDVPALITSIPYPLYFVAKKELQYMPFFGWALKAMGHVLIDRSNRQQATASINRAADRIRNGLSVMVFAEGTRSATGQVAPFKKGAFVLAIKAGVPVLPVSISGSLDILPVGALAANPGTIHLKIHPPIATTGYRLDAKEDLVRKVEAVVRDGVVSLASARIEADPLS